MSTKASRIKASHPFQFVDDGQVRASCVCLGTFSCAVSVRERREKGAEPDHVRQILTYMLRHTPLPQRAVYAAVWSATGHCAMATNGRFDALMKDALGLFQESLRRQTILALMLGS